jgi:hypothetical protein
MLKVLPEVFAHMLAGTLMLFGRPGGDEGVIFPVLDTELVPQPLTALTETVPVLGPIVTVTEVVVLGVGIDQPVPVTDHKYEVASGTAAILKVFPVLLAHIAAGLVIVPGVAGIFVGSIFPVV